MWVGYADGRNGTSEKVPEAEERQAGARVLTARKVEPKQAVLWMQMQRDAQVAACVDSTSRTVEVWGLTRQVLAVALALYVGKTVRRGRGTARDRDPYREMHRVRKVMAMVDYRGATGGLSNTLYRWCAHEQGLQVRRTKESPTWYKMVSHGGWWHPRGTGSRRSCTRRTCKKEWNTCSSDGSVKRRNCQWEGERRCIQGPSGERRSHRWAEARETGKQRTSKSRSDWQSNESSVARKGTNQGG